MEPGSGGEIETRGAEVHTTGSYLILRTSFLQIHLRNYHQNHLHNRLRKEIDQFVVTVLHFIQNKFTCSSSLLP